MKLRHKHITPPRIEMLPLIDIVFLLLVFFIYAMLSMAVQRGMELDLPKSSQAKQSKESPMSLSVLKQDTRLALFLNKQPVTLTELQHQLTNLQNSSNPPRMLIFAEKNITYQQLYLVLDELKKIGIKDISLQAVPE